MAKRANEIIASTYGLSLSEINEYRYQDTRTPIPVYAFSGSYYCCPKAGKNSVKDLPTGFQWIEAKDQFFAQREGRLIYTAKGE